MNVFDPFFSKWLLVLVINTEMVERTEFDTHSECMGVGTAIVDATFGDTNTPQDWKIEGRLDGFFCEEKLPEHFEEPESLTQVIPKCLAPARECS